MVDDHTVSLSVQKKVPDGMFNYSSAVFNDGLLLLELRDAVHGGDSTVRITYYHSHFTMSSMCTLHFHNNKIYCILWMLHHTSKHHPHSESLSSLQLCVS